VYTVQQVTSSSSPSANLFPIRSWLICLVFTRAFTPCLLINGFRPQAFLLCSERYSDLTSQRSLGVIWVILKHFKDKVVRNGSIYAKFLFLLRAKTHETLSFSLKRTKSQHPTVEGGASHTTTQPLMELSVPIYQLSWQILCKDMITNQGQNRLTFTIGEWQ